MKYQFYVITTEISELNRNHLDIARATLAEGATMIQFREKTKSSREMYEVAKKLKELTQVQKIPLIINDRVDLALAVGADGVHLGKEDLPLPVARKIMGSQAVIGASVSSEEEAKLAQEEGASYLGVGPVFPTLSKEEAGPPLSIEVLMQIKEKVALPVIAIGGITLDNVTEVLKTGVDGIAVISAIARAENMQEAAKKLLDKIESYRV